MYPAAKQTPSAALDASNRPKTTRPKRMADDASAAATLLQETSKANTSMWAATESIDAMQMRTRRRNPSHTPYNQPLHQEASERGQFKGF